MWGLLKVPCTQPFNVRVTESSMYPTIECEGYWWFHVPNHSIKKCILSVLACPPVTIWILSGDQARWKTSSVHLRVFLHFIESTGAEGGRGSTSWDSVSTGQGTQHSHTPFVYTYICSNYTCTHVHNYTCTRVHMYTCRQLHMYTCTHVHMYTCTQLHMYTCTQLHMYTITHVHNYTCTHVHMYTCTHSNTHVHTYVHKVAYTHVHIHMYIQICTHTCTYKHVNIHMYT